MSKFKNSVKIVTYFFFKGTYAQFLIWYIFRKIRKIGPFLSLFNEILKVNTLKRTKKNLPCSAIYLKEFRKNVSDFSRKWENYQNHVFSCGRNKIRTIFKISILSWLKLSKSGFLITKTILLLTVKNQEIQQLRICFSNLNVSIRGKDISHEKT